MSWELVAVKLLQTEWEDNPATIQAAIGAAEGGLVGFVANALKDVKLSGIAGELWTLIEPQLANYVPEYVAKYGEAYVYALIGTELAAEVKALGG
ncbi:MAG: hypothetical protein KGL39_09040 [Patescibacteria group bacterium]|nr:hypothetical protein [Patescibacteria group bacterium]